MAHSKAQMSAQSTLKSSRILNMTTWLQEPPVYLRRGEQLRSPGLLLLPCLQATSGYTAQPLELLFIHTHTLPNSP